jgi:hypothetical protein
MSSGEVAAWARAEELSSDAVRDALWITRPLVKLWPTRATLHLLPAHTLGLWLGGSGTPAGCWKKHSREAAAAEPARVTRLLPGFDMWVIGAAASHLRSIRPTISPYRAQGCISRVLR